tara:strand:+ start:1059 stop:1169 length:111 start_codon:yes stop_codon:yes gene_type:complete
MIALGWTAVKARLTPEQQYIDKTSSGEPRIKGDTIP